jgi:hypothetical protein
LWLRFRRGTGITCRKNITRVASGHIMSEQDFSFRLKNARESRVKVWVEPWGELHLLEPGKQLKIEVRGPIGTPPNDALEIHASEESITLWGWTGSGINVNKL